jgi:hypothetical protein
LVEDADAGRDSGRRDVGARADRSGGVPAPARAVISVVAVTGLCVLALTHRPPA